MKIYTRTGDNGETGLLGGLRVSKAHQAIEVCGSLDETNCWLGLVRCEITDSDTERLLQKIQNELFDLGSRIAGCLSESARPASFPDARITDLEAEIDRFDGSLAPLKAFILPSGSEAGCRLHMARSVCRRSERQLIALVDSLESSNLTTESVYLNRLSDLLFVLARHVNHVAGMPETSWNADASEKAN